MAKDKQPIKKNVLHPRNKHKGQYDFAQLIKAYPLLANFIQTNIHGKESLDFFDPLAVKTLNKALLKSYYKLNYWDIPDQYLCPPIPGRADYIHHIADLLASNHQGQPPRGNKIRVLDLGVGANCIYPILGVKEYGWSFVGADINKTALMAAHKNIVQNNLHAQIELRWQKNPKHFFQNIIQDKESFALSICNPPFYASKEEAQQANLRKLSNLKKSKSSKTQLNFGGQQQELWCQGGEEQFVCNMILESKKFAHAVQWCSSLIAQEVHLKKAYKTLKQVAAKEVKTIKMGQGNKKSRLLAWRF